MTSYESIENYLLKASVVVESYNKVLQQRLYHETVREHLDPSDEENQENLRAVSEQVDIYEAVVCQVAGTETVHEAREKLGRIDRRVKMARELDQQINHLADFFEATVEKGYLPVEIRFPDIPMDFAEMDRQGREEWLQAMRKVRDWYLEEAKREAGSAKPRLILDA